MAALKKIALHTNHQSRKPLAQAELTVGGGTAHGKFDHVEFTIRGDYRYQLMIEDPKEAAKVAAWIAYMLGANLNLPANPAGNLRDLANMIEAGTL